MKIKPEAAVFYGLIALVTVFVLFIGYAAETGHIVSNSHGTYPVCKVPAKIGCAVWGYNKY